MIKFLSFFWVFMGARLEDRGLKKKPKIADKIIENHLPFSIHSASKDAVSIVGDLLFARA
jgi:hypothetical protein